MLTLIIRMKLNQEMMKKGSPLTVASFPWDCEKSHRSEAEPRNFPCLRVKRDQRFDYELMICNGTKCIRTTNPDYLQMCNDRDWIVCISGNRLAVNKKSYSNFFYCNDEMQDKYCDGCQMYNC